MGKKSKQRDLELPGVSLATEEDDDCRPMLPLDSPGLAPPGPDFVAAAQAVVGDPPLPPAGRRTKADADEWEAHDAKLRSYMRKFDNVLHELYRRALYSPDFVLKVRVKQALMPAAFVPGHRWGYAEHGPAWQSDVMVVGKMPGVDEVAKKYQFQGPRSNDLYRALLELGLHEDDYADWYVTNAIRHSYVDPSSDKVGNSMISNCRPLLQMEMRLVRPKYILCFGLEAAKLVLGRNNITITALTGKVEDVEIPITDADGKPAVHVAKMMVATNPASVYRRPEQYGGMFSAMSQFNRLRKAEPIGAAETGLRHVCLYTEQHLAAVVDEIIAESTGTDVIAIDCEWHGKMPTEDGAYLRTVQFSHKAKNAFCVVLRKKGGEKVFRGGIEGMARQLNRLLKSTPEREVRPGGHFFRADLPWLLYAGVDILDEFDAAPKPSGGAAHGGWDTGYMAHAYREAADTFKLEVQASHHVGIPRYDGPLQAWKNWYCARHKMKDAELDGYGECPDAVLHPYALYDADATRRLFDRFSVGTEDKPALLDLDEYGNSSRKAAWLSQIASTAFLEMEMTGVSIDRVRADEITRSFVKAKALLEEDFRARIGWPDFNPNSVYHCRDLIYGSRYNGKDTPDGKPKRIRPKGVESLGLAPIKASGAKGKVWADLISAGEDHLHNPSTDKETLGILMHSLYEQSDELGKDGKPVKKLTEKGRIVKQLRDMRFLGQVLKGVLRKPMEDDGGDLIYDEDGNLLYDGGLLCWIDHDGRVRTHFYPVETGRCSSSRPNLQNISKRRESDYARILGTYDKDTGEPKGDYLDVFGVPLYKHKIRSMIAAAPGCVLIEADFKMAEMAMIGWLAGDAAMIEHVRLNTLPEDHPEYLDLHSLTAINAFHLDTPDNRAKVAAKGVTWKASKKVLEIIGVEHLRVAAKNVNFGVPYQRSAEAIARQCREEGVDVSVAEAQELIDNYYATYPQIGELLAECKNRAHVGWIMGPMGRLRRFERSSDRQVMAEMERQACNLPIQNGVAEAINLACRNLMRFKKRHQGPETFSMCLQIHDALLFEVPIPYIDWFIKDVLEPCMRDNVHIRPRGIDGTKMDIPAPYHLDIDTEVFLHWGDKISAHEGEEKGIPPHHCAKPKAPKAATADVDVVAGQKLARRRVR